MICSKCHNLRTIELLQDDPGSEAWVELPCPVCVGRDGEPPEWVDEGMGRMLERDLEEEMSKQVKVPTMCPDCKGSGYVYVQYEGVIGPSTAICPQCLGTGRVGYALRTRREIDGECDLAWQAREREEG